MKLTHIALSTALAFTLLPVSASAAPSKQDLQKKIESLEKEACKIILQSNGKLLSFKIGLEASTFHPFHYKLTQLDELSVREEI